MSEKHEETKHETEMHTVQLEEEGRSRPSQDGRVSEDRSQSRTAAVPQHHQRVGPVDTLRGVLCMLLALDTAVFFTGERVAAEFFWDKSLQLKGNSMLDHMNFETRFWVHAAIVGFFLLCGMSMAFYADHRRNERKWGWPRILFYFFIRGLFLFVLQLVCENVALLLRAVTLGQTSAYLSEPPIATSDYPLYFGALHTLGFCMMIGSFVLFFESRFHTRKVNLPIFGVTRIGTLIVFALCCICTLVTQFIIPFIPQTPDCCDPFAKWLVIAGQAGGTRGSPNAIPLHYNTTINAYPITINVERVFIAYPIVPWLGVWLFGVLLARMFVHLLQERRAYRYYAFLGCVFIVAFVFLRALGVSTGFWFGNFRIPTINNVEDITNAFFTLSAFPPDITYLLFWTGILLIMLWFIYITSMHERFIARPANYFGRASLFFHLAQLWLYLLLGWIWSRQRNGDPIYYAYPVWFLGLAILYPFCAYYAEFKSRRSPGSIVWFL